MKKNLLKLTKPDCIWRVTFDDKEKHNQFVLTKEANGSTRIVEKYADFFSCICHLNEEDAFKGNDNWGAV